MLNGKGMKVSLLVSATLLCAALVGCAPHDGKTQVEANEKNDISKTEVSADASLGKLETHKYSGVVTESSGERIRYSLTVQNREYSGDGVFKLIKNCLNAENKTCKSVEYLGRRYTQRGIPGDNDATVWQLKADDGTIFNFLYNSTDNTLTLLNDNFEIAGAASDYTLKPEE